MKLFNVVHLYKHFYVDNGDFKVQIVYLPFHLMVSTFNTSAAALPIATSLSKGLNSACC